MTALFVLLNVALWLLRDVRERLGDFRSLW